MAKLFTGGKVETVATEEWVKRQNFGGGTPPGDPEQPDTSGIPEAPDDGKQYGRQEGQWTEIKRGRTGKKGDKGDPGESSIRLLEGECDEESPWAFSPDVAVLDKNGQPTGEILQIGALLPKYDHILNLFGDDFVFHDTGWDKFTTPWDKLKAMSHEESLALIAEQDGKPISRFLTFWEYRKLFPEGMTREEYSVSRRWIFEYDGTTWNPTEMIDPS